MLFFCLVLKFEIDKFLYSHFNLSIFYVKLNFAAQKILKIYTILIFDGSRKQISFLTFLFRGSSKRRKLQILHVSVLRNFSYVGTRITRKCFDCLKRFCIDQNNPCSLKVVK